MCLFLYTNRSLFIICSSKQIIKGNIKIIRKFYKRFVIGFSFHILISRNCILIHIKVKSKL